MEGEIKLPAFRKVWLTGTTLAVSIPREIREQLGIEKGDRVGVIFTNQVFKSKNDQKKKKETKKEVKGEKKEEVNTTSLFTDNEEESRLPEIFGEN